MKTKCILATNNKEDLQKMLNQYFYSENYIITEDNRVYNRMTEKYLDDFIIQEKKSRWSFRRIEEA